jgi:hypothetical protein
MLIPSRQNPTALLVGVLPLAILLLGGCGDQPPDQVGGQAGEPLDLPATPEQLEKLERVVERFPEVRPLADQARADGSVTEQEIIEVFTAAEAAKATDDKE